MLLSVLSGQSRAQQSFAISRSSHFTGDASSPTAVTSGQEQRLSFAASLRLARIQRGRLRIDCHVILILISIYKPRSQAQGLR